MPFFSDPKLFLAQYWQQKSCLMRQIFTKIALNFEAADLAGLAVDEMDVPARIIIERNKGDWEVKYPPFSDADFLALPETHWTLLINDIERYFPELQSFIEAFRHLPAWRMDDLMISYASDQGSVGPHLDEYDVFLIQLKGKRRWKLIERADYPQAMKTDCPLAILKTFDADTAHLLAPGDVLYLPPKMPHYGIAEGECMTLSVGFRAPKLNDLMQHWVGSFADNSAFDLRYADPKRPLQSHSAEITAQDMTALSKWMINAIETQKSTLPRWLGRYLTEPCLVEVPFPNPQLSFASNAVYERLAGLRFNYSIIDQQLIFFAGGRDFNCDMKQLNGIQFLSQETRYTPEALDPFASQSDFIILFNALLQAGFILEI